MTGIATKSTKSTEGTITNSSLCPVLPHHREGESPDEPLTSPSIQGQHRPRGAAIKPKRRENNLIFVVFVLSVAILKPPSPPRGSHSSRRKRRAGSAHRHHLRTRVRSPEATAAAIVLLRPRGPLLAHRSSAEVGRTRSVSVDSLCGAGRSLCQEPDRLKPGHQAAPVGSGYANALRAARGKPLAGMFHGLSRPR
jgi:hypothetical protein